MSKQLVKNNPRRRFQARAIALALGGVYATFLGLSSSKVLAQAAQAKPEFRQLNPARTPDVEKGKIEVVEFFWVGCPHCAAFEPSIKEWKKKLPPDVVFKRVHVPFREEKHQQLFYTLESMGKIDEYLDKVFYAIHVDKNSLDTLKKMTEWADKNGLDGKAFAQTFESFGVKTKMKKAASMTTEYQVEGVPALVVNGKFYTAPSMAGSNGGALRVVDQFIEQERKAKK